MSLIYTTDTCVYVYLYIYMYVGVSVWFHVEMCVCMCPCACVHIHKQIYVCVCVRVRAYIFLKIHVYIHTQTVRMKFFACTYITSRSPDAEIENFDTSLFFGFIVWCGYMMNVVWMYVVRERQGGAEKKNLLV